MPENSTHKCTNADNNVQPIRNSSHMANILSVCNRLQAGDYENGNGSKRRVSRLTQFIHATLHLLNGFLIKGKMYETIYISTQHTSMIRLTRPLLLRARRQSKDDGMLMLPIRLCGSHRAMLPQTLLTNMQIQQIRAVLVAACYLQFAMIQARKLKGHGSCN